MSDKSGLLYVIGTPIGNLQDMTPRSVETLQKVDLVLAEDTRHSKRLLSHFGINAVLQSYHDFNERDITPKLLDLLEDGKNIALISDAGTPLISDPGYHLVKAAHERKIRVVPVPGASALITALSAAGIATGRFIFEGFLPEKREARRKRMQELCVETRTAVYYEAPHRILAFLEDAGEIFGEDRVTCICRELTKKFETVYRDTLSAVVHFVSQDELQRKGEFVVIIEGCDRDTGEHEMEYARIINVLLDHNLPLKEVSAITAEITGGRKNHLYKLALELNGQKRGE